MVFLLVKLTKMIWQYRFCHWVTSLLPNLTMIAKVKVDIALGCNLQWKYNWILSRSLQRTIRGTLTFYQTSSFVKGRKKIFQTISCSNLFKVFFYLQYSNWNTCLTRNICICWPIRMVIMVCQRTLLPLSFSLWFLFHLLKSVSGSMDYFGV